jgi:hypothetical protein
MTGLIDIDFDLSDIRRRCADANAVLRQGVRGAVMTAAKEGLETSKARRRYKDRTGNLTRKAYVGRDLGGPNDANAVIVWPVPYAAIVDGGSRAHSIFPKQGAGFRGPVREGQGRKGRGAATPSLAFTVGGRLVFAKSVKHPGTSGYGFAGDAYTKAEAVLTRECEIVVARAEAIFNR